MASIIKIKRSTTPGSAPTGLQAGELAINLPDKKLFSSDGTTVFQISASDAPNYLQVANSKNYLQVANSRTYLQVANSKQYLQVSNATTLFNNRLTVANSKFYLQVANSKQYLQVSNATTLFNNKLSVANSRFYLQVANSKNYLEVANSRNYLQVANSKTYLQVANSKQYLQVANAISVYLPKANPSSTGTFLHTGDSFTITGNTHIDGNLTVEGGVTYISSQTLNVDDSMIKFSANNSADTVDTGFYGKYVSSGTKYSGLFRDATDGGTY